MWLVLNLLVAAADLRHGNLILMFHLALVLVDYGLL